MIPWAVVRAGRAALFLSGLFMVLALLALWLSYRFVTWPVRHARGKDPQVVKRQALMALFGAGAAYVAAHRAAQAAELELELEDEEPEPPPSSGGGRGYTPLHEHTGRSDQRG